MAFDSFGRMMSKGADRYAARLLRGKQSAFNLFRSISNKFGETSKQVIDDVISFAKSGLASGRMLNASEKSGNIEPDQIPTNPYLFGGDSGQGRAIVLSTIYTADGNEARDMSVILPSNLAWPDYNESLDELFKIYTTDSPRWANSRGFVLPLGATSSVWYASKQF